MRTERFDSERIILEPQDNNNDILGGYAQVEDIDSVEQELRVVLRSRYWLLKFPPLLEKKFINQYITRSITLFHFRAPFLMFLFLV